MPDQGTRDLEAAAVPEDKGSVAKAKRSGAFTDNMALPVHRWFRYSAGFSAAWAESVVRSARLGRDDLVFDPFAGSATTLLAAQRCGVRSAGAENHPFVARIARAKLSWWADERQLLEAATRLLDTAKASVRAAPGESADILTKCYTPDALIKLQALRAAFSAQPEQDAAIGELLWLAITAILRECSGVGTAQWQYVLPGKTKSRTSDPFLAFAARIGMFCADMAEFQRDGPPSSADLRLMDSRSVAGFEPLRGRVGLVVTSPPYPNNYDYADATRLEMTFWGEVDGWAGLQGAVRHRLIRSCSQHSAAERLELFDLLQDPAVAPIRDELAEVCGELARVRETKKGKKTYHTMVAAYFGDLARTWQALRPLCRDGAELCFVIGDSAPYGVHVPVDAWLTRLAEASGFTLDRFDKVRDRNLKWKNRKHRVPLKEGNLWLKV